jgi:hypothetical protein
VRKAGCCRPTSWGGLWLAGLDRPTGAATAAATSVAAASEVNRPACFT